jgi:alkylation response protein AidB-like acyl-CoA dehydrogenase
LIIPIGNPEALVMHATFSEEQEEFRRVLRRFLEERSPETEVRRLMETAEGFDREVWKQACSELGLAGLHVPEEFGGQGFGFVEFGVALEECGRALLCAPFFASAALAAHAVLLGATEAERKEILPAIASGDTIATLAFTEPGGRWDIPSIALTAARTSDGWSLDGVKSFVLDGHVADRVVVAARLPGTSGSSGIGLFVVPGEAAGLERRLLETMDATRKLTRLEFSGVPAEALGEPGEAAAALGRTLDLASIALACEMIGGAQKVLEATTEYAKVRVQFGRPIGSFQAIKHRLAELLLEVELAKSAAYVASEAAAADTPELAALASLAKACCSDAYRHVASESIQIHGGGGFTWENSTHLYFKRARSSEFLLGDPDSHRERMLAEWGIT